MNYFYFVFLFLPFIALIAQPVKDPEQRRQAYRANLDQLRKEWKTVRDLPDIPFFLFGMGNRRKLIYKDGELKDALTGERIGKWPVATEIIVPSEYLVHLKTADGRTVQIQEDEKGVYVWENGKRKAISESSLQLPSFGSSKYGPVLKVLHHEVLINVNKGKPVPNFFVYQKPWNRDATLMGMVMKETGNLHLIKDWILQLRDPFDRNNHGISEADNPGEVLFLLSLVTDQNHPLVKITLDSVRQFQKENYIAGQTDYAQHPVFQTKWMKYGLRSLGLPDPYQIPDVPDSYSSLFWWDFKDQHVTGKRFGGNTGQLYPYLVWAEDHFYGERNGAMTNRDYPLSWESKASDAYYPGLQILDKRFTELKLSAPHTWHAAEMFLLLKELK